MAAAATLNHADADADADESATRAAESVPAEAIVPADAIIPAPTEAPTKSETSDAESIEPTDIVDPLLSDAFTAMTPDEQTNGREWIETQTITVACMKGKGYADTFEPFWESEGDSAVRPVMWVNTLPTSERANVRLAPRVLGGTKSQSELGH